MHGKRSSTLLLVTLIISLLTLPVHAQFRAGIQGTVLDTTGAVIPGATVTVTNQETGISQQTQSTGAGFYRVTGLAPGKYRVTVEFAGFRRNVIPDFEVRAEEVRGLDVTLQAGAVEEVITVSGEGMPTVQAETATVSGTITTKEIANLPQIGRSPYELLRLTPGVFGDSARTGGGQARNLPQQVGPGGSNEQIFQVENQVQIVANGQRVTANNITLDGVSVNSLDWGGAAVVTPNQESVAEATVVTSTFSGEDGRNTGAQVKVVSRTGTNTWHGSSFIKFNDKGLNAFNKFYGPTNVPLSEISCEVGTPDEFKITAARCPERVNQKYRQFGGSFGGPIFRERLFFFFSYEGVRRNDNRLERDIKLEAPAFRSYVIANNPNSIAADIFSTPGIEPRIVNTIQEVDCCSLDGRALGTWYQPGIGIGQAIGDGPDGTPDWGRYDLLIPGNAVGDQFNGRVDLRPNDKDQFFFGMYYTRRDDVQGGRRATEDLTFQPKNWTGTVGWTRTLGGAIVNEFRANLTRFAFNQLEPVGSTNYGIPQIRLFDFDAGGLGDPGRIIGIARSSTTPAKLAQNTLALRDVLSWVRGEHALKFGIEFSHEQNNNDLRGGYRPDYQFRGLLNFANDACCFFQAVSIDPGTGGVPNGSRHFRTGAWAAFVQDDWKLRQNLTLNLSLRWEYFPPLTETDDRMTNYIFGSNGFIDGSVEPVTELFEPDRNNFSPRIGAAWAPGFGGGKLVLRAGAGINYNRHFGVTFNNIRQNTPFFADAGICCFFDPGVIVGPPPGSNMQYNIGTSASAFSYPANPNLAFGVAPDGALCGDATCSFVTQVDLFGALPEEPNPYVYTFVGGIEYEFPRNLVLSLGYNGSRTRKLVRTIDLNRLIPGDTFDNNRDRVQNQSADGTPCGAGNPECPAPRPTGNNRFNRIFFPLPDVNASYDSMVATLRHRFAYGLDFTATYTWGHSIDTASYEVGFQQTDPYNQELNKASSDYDVRHNFVLATVWELPFLRGRNDAVGKVLGGWTISGILSKHSGFPFSALLGSCDVARDRNGDSYCPDLPFTFAGGFIADADKQQWINGVFPNPLASFPGATFIPDPSVRGEGCRCRNIFTGPGYTSVDMTVAKQFGLPQMPFFGEAAKLDVRANFFNVLNTLNLSGFTPATAPTDIINTGQFGKVQSGLAGRVVELQARFSF